MRSLFLYILLVSYQLKVMFLNYFRYSIAYNQIVSHIPDKLGKLVYLEQLVLSHNKLSEIIPTTNLHNLNFLETLNLSHNYLENKIPDELCNLNYFQYSILEDV